MVSFPTTLPHFALPPDDDHDRKTLEKELMEKYYEALLEWLRRKAWPNLGDPQDLLHEFFMSRFWKSSPKEGAEKGPKEGPKEGPGQDGEPVMGYLDKWRDANRKTKIPLRKFLTGSLWFFFHERYRRKQLPSLSLNDQHDNLSARLPDPDLEKDVAMACAKVALNRCEVECDKRGLGEHFQSFRAVTIEGMNYGEVAHLREVPVDRVRRQVRTVRDRLRREVIKVVREELNDPNDPARIDSELRTLLRQLSRSSRTGEDLD